MNAASFLSSVIDIAIGVAGFAGIVAAVRQRRLDHWSREQVVLLQILFTATAASIVFGLLPAFLLEAGLRERTAWQVASGALITWIVTAIGFRMRQSRSLGVRMPIPRHVTVWGVVSVGLLIYNVAGDGKSWPYLFGIMGLLMNGFSVFLILVLGSTDGDDGPVLTTETQR
jgi:hypothetical protein